MTFLKYDGISGSAEYTNLQALSASPFCGSVTSISIMNLPVVSYGCKAWFRALREERRLRVLRTG